MHIATLVSVLDHPHLAAEHLQGWGITDIDRARRALLELADTGLSLDLIASLSRQLAEYLPQMPNADDALHAFCRYVSAVRGPFALASLLERDLSALPMLLGALCLGPRWTRLMIADPEAFDLLRQSEGQALDRVMLVGDILTEIEAFSDERSIIAAMARMRDRHGLRIAFGEVSGQQSVESAWEQLAWVAEALVEAALRAAEKKVEEMRPLPARIKRSSVRSAVIALGRLGSGEMDYGSPLELLVVYDAAVEDAATLRALHEHFERVAKLLVRLLAEANEGVLGEVHLVSLPNSAVAAAAHSAEDLIIGLDGFGRTWHRQEYLSARPIAGDGNFGDALLKTLETWLFRRYLSRADETGIKALKRRIIMEATLHQDDWRNPRLARGGLRNIESLVAFLQLLAGGDQPAARRRGTLAALAGLEQAGTVTPQEHGLLKEGYVFLRRLEHRLQIALDSPTAELPDDDALASQFADGLDLPNSIALLGELRGQLARNWQIIVKLLESAFPEEPATSREVELLLDPDPPLEEVRAALAPFGFARPREALAALNDLAAEQIPFLSTRRCRHLLAAILPQLLCSIAATPSPDETLDNLTRVSNSLGGKGVLWELFRFNPPSLQLYVRLCAASPYLSEILITNPGMIDELVDSLQLDRLPERTELASTLDELCRGAADTMPILHDFKNAQHLRIGVRDILGKEDVDRTHQGLADIAETCLSHVAGLEYQKLVEKFGVPSIGLGPTEGQPCAFVVVGLRKLGGREPNYHSNLDVLFLYEAEGTTRPTSRLRRTERTANNHFFTQLAQRITKQLALHTPKGRLYTIDALLRPIGLSGALALSLADFQQHFAGGAAPLWQWQALCQARSVIADRATRDRFDTLLRNLLRARPQQPGQREELRRSRLHLEKGATAHNLKRGPGGTLDVEFLVQSLQLENAAANAEVLITNTQDALVALTAAGLLRPDIGEKLSHSYRFLRRVESALRLLNTSARHDLPSEPQQLGQLALLLGHSNPNRLRDECLSSMAANRAVFDEHLPRP